MNAGRGRGSAGQATVEFALLLPVLAAVLLGIVQVGLVVRDYVAVVHAAREAARTAAVEPDRRPVEEAVRRVLASADVVVGRRGPVGTPIEVEVRYRARTDVPIVGPLIPDPLLRVRASMRIER